MVIGVVIIVVVWVCCKVRCCLLTLVGVLRRKYLLITLRLLVGRLMRRMCSRMILRRLRLIVTVQHLLTSRTGELHRK